MISRPPDHTAWLNLILVCVVALEPNKHIGVILGFGLCATYVFVYCLRAKQAGILLTPFSVCIFLFSLWCVVSFLLQPVLEPGLLGLLLYLTLPVAYVLGRCLFKTDAPFISFLKLNAIFCAFNVMLGLVQVFTGQGFTGLFIQPNTFAAYLNLTLLPLFFLWLMEDRDTGRDLLLPVLNWVMILGLFFTVGRGGILSFIIICTGLILVFYGRIRKSRLIASVVFILVVMSGSELLLQQSIGSRLEQTVGDIKLEQGNEPVKLDSSLNERLIIWQQTIRMIQDSSLLGHGPLSFLTQYPASSPSTDNSSRQYTHNDYLQYWFELGLAGLFMILFIPGYLGFLVLINGLNQDMKEQTLFYGVCAGMLAVCLHSLVTYNFYVIPILVLTGAGLGYIDNLMLKVKSSHKTRQAVINPLLFRYAVMAAGLIVIVLTASLLSMHFALHRAKTALAGGDIATAEQWSTRSIAFFETSDNYFVRGLGYIEALDSLAGSGDLERRRQLYDWARQSLKRSIELNSWSSDARYGLARLYSNNPDLAGNHWVGNSIYEFKRALELDPRFALARMDFALLLEHMGKVDEARQLMETGTAYRLPASQVALDYADTLIRLRERDGDWKAADRLRNRLPALQISIDNLITD